MRIIQALPNKLLKIGFQGENDALAVTFDVKGWDDLYGQGTFALMNQRPTETTGYPCTVTLADDVVTWKVSNADVAIPGNGRVQLVYTVGTLIAKSVQYCTEIYNSIGSGEIPAPVPDWVWEVRNELAEMEEQIQVATNAEIDAALYG